MWLPGFERMPISGRAGVPYDEYDDPKAMWHTTQGTSIAGAVQAYAPYPPHLIADPKNRRKGQHIDLNYAAYALWNEDVDDSRCVQIEVVGYAEQAKHWPDEYHKWLGEEIARPLHEYFGVPYVAVWKGFKGPEDVDYILADASSPLRLTQWEIDHFSGHLAHQHSPGDSHWDAPFRMDKILTYAQGNTARKDSTMEVLAKVRGIQPAPHYILESSVRGRSRRYLDDEVELNVLLAGGHKVTEINSWDLDRYPEDPNVDARQMWNYSIPNGQTVTTPEGEVDLFSPAHRVVANIAHDTTPDQT